MLALGTPVCTSVNLCSALFLTPCWCASRKSSSRNWCLKSRWSKQIGKEGLASWVATVDVALNLSIFLVGYLAHSHSFFSPTDTLANGNKSPVTDYRAQLSSNRGGKKVIYASGTDARSWWILPPANKINAMWAREDDPASRNEEMRLIQAYSPRFVGWYGSSELCACQKKTVTAHIINTSIIQGSIIGKMPYHILRISPTSLQFLKLDNGTNSHLSREHHKRWTRRKTLLNVLPHDVPYTKLNVLRPCS